MSTQVRAVQPGRQLRSAWVALALSPVGFTDSLLVMLGMSALLGLPILTARDQVVMGGTREPTLVGAPLVIGAGAQPRSPFPSTRSYSPFAPVGRGMRSRLQRWPSPAP